MNVYRGLSHCSEQHRVITLGVFDGVHRGHEKIIRSCVAQAKALGVLSAVVTFDDHPHGVLAPKDRPPKIATPEQCLNRMQQLGVDEVFLVRFTQRLANTPAETFVRDSLVKCLQIRQVVVGQDFVFGKGGAGSITLLRRLGKSLGFGVTVVAPLKTGGTIISSSRLRTVIAQGHMDQAHAWLGWPYALHGMVVHGDGRGAQIGIPTANLKTKHEIIPAPGTYLVVAYLENQAWPALCHIGVRPTFRKTGSQTIEIHILGWAGDLYGKPLMIEFLSFLRSERKFPSVPAFLEQIKKDRLRAQQIWERYSRQLPAKSV